MSHNVLLFNLAVIAFGGMLSPRIGFMLLLLAVVLLAGGITDWPALALLLGIGR